MKQNYTDIAAELYAEACGTVPSGVRTHTASAAGIRLTRVDILRGGLRRAKGSYITLDMPHFARIDPQDETFVHAIASQLRALLPAEGMVLVAGIGNRAVTPDALGPATVDKVFVTAHSTGGHNSEHGGFSGVASHSSPTFYGAVSGDVPANLTGGNAQEWGCRAKAKASAAASEHDSLLKPITHENGAAAKHTAAARAGTDIPLRTVAAVSPGVAGTTGLATADILRALTQQLHPAAVLVVDSLCTATPSRLGSSVQLSSAGLCPQHAPEITQRTLGVPVVAIGVPMVTQLPGAFAPTIDAMEHANNTDADAAAKTSANINPAQGRTPLLVTPKDVDTIVARASCLLALAINKALQPALSVGELSFLTS